MTLSTFLAASCEVFCSSEPASFVPRVAVLFRLVRLEIFVYICAHVAVLAVAECLAENGHEVKILHAVHYKDPLYRKVFGELIGTRYYRKCPDLLVDGEFVEYESYTSSQPKNALRNMLHNGLAQSDRVIIRHCNLTDGYVIQQVHGQIQNGVPVLGIWAFDGKKVKVIYNTEG